MATTSTEQVRDNELIRELAALNLDPEEFVIFGSAPLLVHGLRATIRDLDVVARGDVMAWARRTGSPAVGRHSGAQVWQLNGGRLQFSSGWTNSLWSPDELIDNAQLVDGLRFARLADVLRYKQELRRPKDLIDIANIQAHGHGLQRTLLSLG